MDAEKITPVKINTVKQQTNVQKSVQLSPQKVELKSESSITPVKVNNIQNVQTTVTPVKSQVTQQPQQVKTVSQTPAKPVQKTASQPAQQTVSKPVTKPATKTVTKTASQPAKQSATPKAAQTAAPKKTAVSQTPAKTQAQIEQEELIQWNKWRSDLQNRIMNDVKLPTVKQGTVFKFSFDVDKYGKITNINTWSTDAMYTPYAIQYIAPVIRSYQGRSFLNFPAGSGRVTTTVSGGWKISDKTTYSTPSDYKDVEKVRN